MKKLIIEQPWGGLGDNLQFSTIPELGSKYGFEVWISNHNKYRNNDIKKLVWDNNPYVCGFTDERGNIGNYTRYSDNIISSWEIKLFGETINDRPKLYYKPNTIDYFLNKIVIDCNAISNKLDFYSVLEKYEKTENVILLNYEYKEMLNYKTSNIFEWVDIITSSKRLICQYSGASVVMPAYNIGCTVYVSENFNDVFKFNINEYLII